MIFSKFLNATNWHKRPYTEILDEVREITDYLDQNSNFGHISVLFKLHENWKIKISFIGPTLLSSAFTTLI